ncbi:hypothetical protein FA95DRAFT_1595187 [Auriscalpium vulgare]|uniref:Uncharacterized protein n=1 Tax=Auriscalpium vulgare TaxID=40419 RepID=A0ACB8RXK9_9AGAM|nr:hypothetical protein FA95DRAFT_1595187 [Auriscalpium vulgare]
MLTSLVSHALSGWFAFLLPSYSLFKALKQRPLPEPEIERWAAYWAVVGVFVAAEYGAEWLLSWFPFYWEVKTLFLLFLSLPQTQGSTYIYKTYLEPFFNKHETDIDAGIASARTETLAFVQARVASLWDFLFKLLNKTPKPASQDGTPAAGSQNPVQSLQGLWNTFGPAVLGAVGQQQAKQPASPAASNQASTPPVAGYNVEHRNPYEHVAED